MATKPPNGIYTFSGRPGSSYKYENNQWFVSNSGTKNQYVPMQDPTGNRAKTLEAGLKSGKTQFTQILPTKSSYNQLTVSTPADNTRVANADFAAAAMANRGNVARAVAAEKKAQYEFEKDKWEDYNKMSPTEKVVDRVDAFLTDPLGMVSRAVSGEQAYIPGMGQGLVDYENPNRNRYLQAVGYTPGKFEASDIQNMANPGYWGASITNNLNKGNYGTAAAETALSLFPLLPKGSGRLVKQGAGMIADDIAKAGNYLTTQTPLRNTYKINPYAVKENPEMFLYRTQPKNFVAGYTEEQQLKDLITDKILKGEKVPFYLQGKLNKIKYQPEPFRKALDEYHGQWFDKNPERMDFYMEGRLDGDEGNILRLKVPKEEGLSYNLKNFPEAQKASLNYDTEFIVPRNKISESEIFSTNDWQQLVQEDKAFNTPNWLRGYKEVPKELPGSPNLSGSKQLIDLSKVDFSKVEKPSEWLSRYQLANKLKNEGLIPTNISSIDFLRNKDVTRLLTKEALERANTVYRATTPDISKVGAKDIMAMLDKGVDLSDEIAVAEYMNTHVPYKSYGDRANPISPGYGQDLLYTGNYENLEEAAKGLSHYGTHISELRPNLDFTTGTPQEWFQKYYQERPFIFTGKGGKNAGLGSRELGWKEGAIASFPGDKKYYPFVGNKGSQLLNAVSTTPISKINYTEVIPPVSTAKPSSMFKSGLGNVGMDMSMYTIKNPDYYTQLLNTYDKKALSATNRKFYKDLIATVKKQDGLVTERQLNELKRLATGNFDFGSKGYNKGYAEGGKLNEWPPKKSPIYVTNPRDSRLKAYNDSLSLYNKTKDIQNPKYYTNGEPSWYNWKGTTKDAEKFMRKNNVDLDYEYYRTGKFPGKIQPIKTGDFGEGMAYPIYKKPIQPYIYKKPELEVIPTFLPPTNVEDGFEPPAIVGENVTSDYKIPDDFFPPSPIANEIPITTPIPKFVDSKRYDSNLKKWVVEPMILENSKEAQYNKEREDWKEKNKFKQGGSLAKNIPTYYDYSGTPIYRDTTALPFPDGGYLSLQNAMLGPLPEREKPNSVLAYNKFVEATKTPNESAYIRPSYYPESNHYKYGFLGAGSGNIYGGAGYGVPKYGLEANVFGSLPAQSDPYYKGFYSAELAKQFGNNQVGLGVSSPVVGYTDDSGFHMDRLELTPQLSFRKNFADGGILDRIRKRLNTKEEEEYNPSKDLSLLHKYNSEIRQIQDLEESDPRRVEYEKANSQFVLDKAKYDEALKSYEDQLLLFNEYNNLDPKAKLQISPQEFIKLKKANENIEDFVAPQEFDTIYSKNYSGIGSAQDFKRIIPDYDQEIFNARRLLNNPDYYMDMSGGATDEQISNIINETRDAYKSLYPNINTVGFLRELDVTAEPFFRGKDRKYTVPKTPQVENYTNYKAFQKIFPNIGESYEGRVADASNSYSSGYGYDRIKLENNPKLAISTYSDSAGRVVPYYKPEFVSYGASNLFSPYPEFSQPNELSPAPVAPSSTYEERVYPYVPVKVYNSKTNTWENRVAPKGSLQEKYTKEAEAWRLRNGNNPSSHLPLGQAPGGTFADGGPLNDKTNHGKILDSVYASAIGDYYANGGMLKRADGSYSRRGLWDNIRAAAARNKAQGKPGKAPTKEMLEQERKINSKANGGFVAGRQMYQPLDIRESYGGFLYGNGGQFPTTFSLPEDSFKQGGNNLHDSVYASSMAQYPAVYATGGNINVVAGGEKHRVYIKESPTGMGEGVKGHVMVNHPTMDKGQWDTIDLTKKAGAKTVKQGIAATKKWHRENPQTYSMGGSILSMSNTPELSGEGKDLSVPENAYIYSAGGSIKKFKK